MALVDIATFGMDKQQDANGGLLNRRQAAKKLKMGVRTIGTWMADGRLPYIKLSPRCVRFLESDIDKLISSHRIS